MHTAMDQEKFLWRLAGKNVVENTIEGREHFLKKLCGDGVLEEIGDHQFQVQQAFDYFNENSQQWVRLIEGKEFYRLPKYTAKEAK